MSDDLLTCIAAALKADICEQAYTLTLLEKEEPYSVLIDGTVNLLEVADAVIRELGLQYERSEWPFDGKHRYVTEWTTDE